MMVKKLNLFFNNGLTINIEAGEAFGITQAQLNNAFQALETKQPTFTIDVDLGGELAREVYTTAEVCFYRATFEKEFDEEEFTNRVIKRLKEVEYVENIVTIILSADDYYKIFYEGQNSDGSLRWIGKEVKHSGFLKAGEFRFALENGETVK